MHSKQPISIPTYFVNEKYVFIVAMAIPVASMGVFALQGQVCIAASRLYVQSRIYDQFVQGAVKFAQSLKIGNPNDPTTQHGPQVFINILSILLRCKYYMQNNTYAYL